MAVGTAHLDPDTQAAIAEQSGGTDTTAQATPAEVKPKEGDVENPSVQGDETQTDASALETPKAADTEPKPSESASEDSTDLDMTKTEAPSQEEVDKALAQAGFSNDDLGQELVDNDGKLTDETIASLKEHFPADAVDNAVKDMESKFAEEKVKVVDKVAEKNADIESMNTYIFSELAGGDVAKGKENLKVLSDWAKSNIDKETLAVINTKLASGNKTVVKEGLETAVTLWKKGQERPMMTGDSAAANNQQPAEKVEPLSRDQFIKIQMTKKYQEDQEYADKIDARRRASMSTEGFMTPEYNANHRPAF